MNINTKTESTTSSTPGGYVCGCGAFVQYGSIHYCSQPSYWVTTPSYDHSLHQKIDKILDRLSVGVPTHCAICGQEKNDFFALLPYGSTHEDEIVCNDCIRRYVDPIIDLAQKSK